MGNDLEYAVRSEDDVVTPCGYGRGGLLLALDHMLHIEQNTSAWILERGSSIACNHQPWCGEVIALMDYNGLLDCGNCGPLWSTRALTPSERMILRHIGPVIASVDLVQATVWYAYREGGIVVSEWEYSSRGLENATRMCQERGFGTIIRHVEGINGEQVVACFTEAGFLFTMCADERERHAITETRALIENFGDAPPVLELNDPRARNRMIAALRSIRGRPAHERITIGQLLLGRAHQTTTTVVPVPAITVAAA